MRRCVINDSSCSSCSNQGKDILHALWSCPNLSQIWDADPQWQVKQVSTQSDFAHLISMVLESGCNYKLFVMIKWIIWFRSNKSSFSPPSFPIDQVLQQAIDALLEFRTAHPPVQPQAARSRVWWIALQDGIYKIKF